MESPKRQRDIIIQTGQNETLTPKPSKTHLSISFFFQKPLHQKKLIIIQPFTQLD